MTLRIITGTIENATDPFGKLQELKDKQLFYKWHWNGKDIGWTYQTCNVLAEDGKHLSFIQTTGSGKTVFATLLSYKAHVNGFKTGGNYSIRWTPRNTNQPKNNWVPEIQSMEEFEDARMMHLTIDDIRGTIETWNSKDARMVSALSLLSRKMGNWIDVTTQALENMVPTDMRRITDEYIVPYIRSVDETVRGPDGRAVPTEILTMRFSPGFALLDYHLWFVGSKLGKWIMDSFSTLEVARGLKKGGEDRPRTNQPGYQLEVKAFEFLKDKIPELKHLNGKQVFDLQSPTHGFDVCQMDESGDLRTEHKHLNTHIKVARKKNIVPYLMFPYLDSWGFIKITNGLAYRHVGDRIDTYKLKIFNIDNISSLTK